MLNNAQGSQNPPNYIVNQGQNSSVGMCCYFEI